MGIFSTLWAAFCFSAISFAAASDIQEDRFAKYQRFTELYAGGDIKPIWIAGGESFYYSVKSKVGVLHYIVDADTGRQEPLFDREKVLTAFSKLPEAKGKSFPFEKINISDDGKKILFDINGATYSLSRENYSVTPLPAGEAWLKKAMAAKAVTDAFPRTSPPEIEKPSPVGGRLLSLQEGNLYIRDAEAGEMTRLAEAATDAAYWTLRGAAWSADGKNVAALHMDGAEVRKAPVVDFLSGYGKVEYHDYPISNGVKHTEKLVLFMLGADGLREQKIVAQVGDESYLVIYGFTPASGDLLYLRLSRYANRVDFMAYDPETGKSRTILTEKTKTFLYYHPEFLWRGQGRLFPRLVNHGEEFIWRSEKNGWASYYLYSMDGKLIRKLGTGRYPVIDIAHIDENNREAYFTAHPDQSNPYDVHLMKASLNGGQARQLTQGSGQRKFSFSPNGEHFVEVVSTRADPPASLLKTSDGSLTAEISRADISPLKALGWTPPEHVTALAADGETVLHGTLYKPADFDPTKSYPVIEYIYGGGFIAVAPRGFRPHAITPDMDFLHALVQLGFVGVIMDARGTPERSKAFQDVVHGNLGRNEIPDHAAALKDIARSRPYMDMGRVGIFGTSYGGFFATRAVLTAPDVYKAAVASAPAVTLAHSTAIGSQAFMSGSINEAPDEWAQADNTRLVDKLIGRFMIIIGTSDLNTPFSQSMGLVNALNEADKPYELVVLPGQNHHFMTAERRSRQPYRQSAIRRFFEEHLLNSDEVSQ